MLAIGLTGGIGTGKTQVSEILRRLGARVIDADLLGHEAYLPETEGWRGVVEAFGEDILDSEGKVDRKKLGPIVFGDPAAMERLNSILHPIMYRMIEERLEGMNQDGAAVAVVEAAILIEAGWSPLADEVWVTTAPEGKVVQRVQQRSNLKEEAIRDRIRSQMAQSERITHADAVIENDGSLEDLEKRVQALWDERNSAHEEKTSTA